MKQVVGGFGTPQDRGQPAAAPVQFYEDTEGARLKALLEKLERDEQPAGCKDGG